MAEQLSYPQVPTNVWWGVRSIFNRNPRTKFDDTTLAIQLDVQPAAARQYLAELKRLGLLTDEGTATEIALSWRMDETYRDATNQMLRAAYPEQLVDLAPPGSADRGQVERWFMTKGLGQGTAKNKAATYILMANSDPSSATAPKQSNSTSTATPKPAPRSNPSERKPAKPERSRERTRKSEDESFEVMPLNVNVQIHISADASSDQIDSIFLSMRKHLYGHPID
ncbi:MAG TPA: hypothetical protein VMS31_17155 [Pyrinomonadaceae bacterium]|nr:hypothetical protein [Pyrinomonadaceae bacterium]